MTGYIIQNVIDRTNAFSDDPDQHFDSLEQARSWADALMESEIDASDADDPPKKSDYVVSCYVDGVQRGEWPLFEDEEV